MFELRSLSSSRQSYFPLCQRWPVDFSYPGACLLARSIHQLSIRTGYWRCHLRLSDCHYTGDVDSFGCSRARCRSCSCEGRCSGNSSAHSTLRTGTCSAGKSSGGPATRLIHSRYCSRRGHPRLRRLHCSCLRSRSHRVWHLFGPCGTCLDSCPYLNDGPSSWPEDSFQLPYCSIPSYPGPSQALNIHTKKEQRIR